MMARILAVTCLVATVYLTAPPVEAGSSCSTPSAYRSGDYVTYTAYGTGPWYHRVRVIYEGAWRSGPWIAGDGYSRITLYHPRYAGSPSCQVLT